MDKAKSMIDKNGASGPFHVNNGQSQRGFHVAVAANGSCCSSNAFGSSTGPNNSTFENMHHLHRGDDEECNGSPAKRCRLRRRTESVRRSRPRKCQRAWGKSNLLATIVKLYILLHDFFLKRLKLWQRVVCKVIGWLLPSTVQYRLAGVCTTTPCCNETATTSDNPRVSPFHNFFIYFYRSFVVKKFFRAQYCLIGSPHFD